MSRNRYLSILKYYFNWFITYTNEFIHKRSARLADGSNGWTISTRWIKRIVIISCIAFCISSLPYLTYSSSLTTVSIRNTTDIPILSNKRNRIQNITVRGSFHDEIVKINNIHLAELSGEYEEVPAIFPINKTIQKYVIDDIYFIFTTNTRRIPHSIKYLRFWATFPGIKCLIVFEHKDFMASRNIKEYLEREGILCEIQTSNVTRYEERCLRLIQHVWNNQKPPDTRNGIANTQWFALGDDDTIWFMNNLLETLQQYNSTDVVYLGDISDRTISIARHGRYFAYGGGGVILSRPLASFFAQHTDECKRFTYMYGGDEMIGKCITEVLEVNLTRNRNFHQMDHFGDMTGYMESGIDGIVTLHHIFSFWHPFTDKRTSDHNETMHLLELAYNIFGNKFLKRYVRINYKANQTLLLTAGYSFSLFNRILSPAELIQVEKTWCCTEMVDRGTRPKETNKTTWYFRGRTTGILNGLVTHRVAYENKKSTFIGIPILEVIYF